MILDVAADGGEPGFGLKARRQFGQRVVRRLMRALDLGAVDGEAAICFEQRRFARGVAVDLALGRRMALTRCIGLALGGAGGFTRCTLGGCGGLYVGMGDLQRLALASRRACSNSCSMSTRRARSARRRAAPVGACAAATKPSQRQTSPSGD